MSVQTQDTSMLYTSSLDYFNDQFMILDLLIEEVIQQSKKLELNAVSGSNKLTMTDDEALGLLRDKLSYLQLSEPYQQLIERLELIISNKLTSTYEQQTEEIAIIQMYNSFNLDDLDRRVLVIFLAPHLNKKYLRLYGFIQNDMTKQFVTLELLVKLAARSAEDIRLLYARYSSIEGDYSLLYKRGDKQNVMFYDSSLLIRPIYPKEQLVQFVSNEQPFHTLQTSVFHFSHHSQINHRLEPLLIQPSLTETMVDFVRQSSSIKPIIQLIGANGSGKTLHTKHLALVLQCSLVEFDLSKATLEKEMFQEEVKDAILVATLTSSILAFIGIDKEHEQVKQKLEWLKSMILPFKGVICFHTLSNRTLHISAERPALAIEMTLPDAKEASKLWQQYCSPYCELSVDEAIQLAHKFRFTCGQIKQTVLHAKQKLLWQTVSVEQKSSTPIIKTLIESAYATIHHDLQKKAIKLETSWVWEDLILPDDTIGLLQQACNRIGNQQKVMDDWGFSRLLPYGRGISMLFTGPPGTGKSMSASVMAKQMKSELYRVDLSSVVSKYIGETEKNLAEIFDEARQSGAILFFDEADALFGKRSEVKDSQDKYANMETSFLLQKMEEYEGLTILATNFAQNLDDAFNRRIQYIVKFPFPDVQQRERLWRSVIPPQLPISDVDFPFLAKTFELTGGPIKNIVLTAAYLAAHDKQDVSMQYMVEAAIQEYKKSGKLLMKDKLGAYSQYWKG